MIFLLFSFLLHCAEEPVFIRGIRPLAMGGAFIAISDDQNSIFYNPAGITQRKGILLNLLEINSGISQDFIDIYNFLTDNQNKITNFDTLSSQERSNLINDIIKNVSNKYAYLNFKFPNTTFITSGKKNFAFGVGFFGEGSGYFKINSGVILPSIDLVGKFDSSLNIPLAYRIPEYLKWQIPGDISFGLNLKYLYRAKIEELRKSIIAFGGFDPVIQPGRAFGVDFGFLWNLKNFNFGLTFQDLGGTKISYPQVSKQTKNGFVKKDAFSSVIPQTINFGIAWLPESLFVIPTNKRLILAFDIRDFSGELNKFDSQTWPLHIHIGFELNLTLLRFRGGYNQGYPTIGFALTSPAISIEYTYFSDELGKFAGLQPLTTHLFSFAIRF